MCGVCGMVCVWYGVSLYCGVVWCVWCVCVVWYESVCGVVWCVWYGVSLCGVVCVCAVCVCVCVLRCGVRVCVCAPWGDGLGRVGERRPLEPRVAGCEGGSRSALLPLSQSKSSPGAAASGVTCPVPACCSAGLSRRGSGRSGPRVSLAQTPSPEGWCGVRSRPGRAGPGLWGRIGPVRQALAWARRKMLTRPFCF